MPLEKFKQYQNQIASTFHRFPVAIAFALIATFIFLHLYHTNDLHKIFELESENARLYLWLSIYPISAAFISVTLKLLQEARGHLHLGIQAAVHALWLAFSVCVSISETEEFFVYANVQVFFILGIASLFTVPFFKSKNDLTLWNFTGKTIKAFIVAVFLSGILCGILSALLGGFIALFEIKMLDDDVFLNIIIICVSFIAPLLFCSGIPTQGAIKNVQPLGRFAKGFLHLFFIPVLAIYILMLYAYTVKIIVQWDLPIDVITILSAISVVLMLVITAILYPAHFDETYSPFDKQLLKVLPIATIPLVILLAVGVVDQYMQSGVEEPFLNFLYFVLWCAAAVAITLRCKNKKLRWTIASVCIFFVTSSLGPFSALQLSYKVTEEKTEQVKSDSAEQNTNADNSEVRDDDAEESVKAVNNTTGATEDIRVSVYSSSWEPSQIPNGYKTFRKINGYVKTENAKIVNDTLTFTLTTVRDRDTCAACFTYSVPVKLLKAWNALDEGGSHDVDSTYLAYREKYNDKDIGDRKFENAYGALYIIELTLRISPDNANINIEGLLFEK